MICILCHAIGPYHAARFNALGQRTQDVTVLELFAQQAKYPWLNVANESGLKVRTLFGDQGLAGLAVGPQVGLVRQALSELGPQVVVSVGYSEAVMRAAARWAHTHRAASIMVTDTWAGDKRRYFPVERAKALWCRARYDGVFIPGVRSQEYFASMGFPPARIWRGVAVVDNDYFADQAANVRSNQDRVRQALGLPGRYFLCVARLSPEKNLVRLISAFDNYRRQGGSWQLVFVGSGPQEEQLRSLAADMAGASIQFAGWRQYPDLPAYYALASCLVLPSLSEPWGLVVNEAMACGLPILVSRKCGCQPELCWRGINGYDFDPYDTGQLAKLMLRISTRESDLAVMGQASREIIASFTPDRWAQALLDCIETVGTCLPRPAQGRKK